MKPIRSMLFIPGSKPNWFKNIPSFGSDAIILDLEDSVPEQLKEEARANVASAIATLAEQNQRIYVRINRTANSFNRDDIQAVVKEGLEGILIPKLYDPQEVEALHQMVADIELENNIEIGTTKFIATLETAKSLYLAYEIALHDRIVGLAGVVAKNGDVARSVGYKWTEEGLETLYYRSKVVLACRAADVLPIGGLWQDVHNLEGLRKNAEFNRQLGFSGELLIHPSNVETVNEVYSLSEEEIAYYKGMIEQFEEAVEKGLGAIMYEGEHIDYAHVNTAKQMLGLVDK